MNSLQLVKNHPRRVFGYLFLTAGLIFAASLLIVIVTESKDLPAAILTLFVTCGLAVLAGIAFGLSVVFPSFRFSWRTLLKRLGWCALWLVTLIVLLVQFENWRGRRAWAAFVVEMKATGDDLSMASVVPPPVPDAENFAMAPMFRGVLDYDSITNHGTFREFVNGNEVVTTRRVTTRWRDTNAPGRLHNLKVVGDKPPKSTGGWRAGKFTDLAAWQEHYRSDTNFPSHPQPKTPGADLLFALAKLDPDLDLLREAAARPKSRFPVHYEDLFTMLLPHLAFMKKLTLLPEKRAVAELAENQVEAASVDALLALRLADALEAESFLISHLVRMAQLEIALTPLWEGMARHQWSETHLVKFEDRLRGNDFLSSFSASMRGERNGGFATFDMMRNQPENYEVLNQLGDSSAGWSSLRFMPSAFTDQSKTVLGRMFGNYFKAVDLKKRLFEPDVTARINKELEALKPIVWRKPYHILATMLMPALSTSAEKFARAQTTVDLARVAIALERHRLKHGTYPETLEAIDPALKPAGGFPHDVISGAPLRYARTAQGRFQLYAVGWNGTDEGGSVVWKNTEKTQIDFTKGDWIWPQPAE